jgi:hypothetical protein
MYIFNIHIMHILLSRTDIFKSLPCRRFDDNQMKYMVES